MPDFTIEDHGSIVLLRPNTPAARAWVGEHLPRETMWFAGAACIEPRYVADIVDGIAGDGLSVQEVIAPCGAATP